MSNLQFNAKLVHNTDRPVDLGYLSRLNKQLRMGDIETIYYDEEWCKLQWLKRIIELPGCPTQINPYWLEWRRMLFLWSDNLIKVVWHPFFWKMFNVYLIFKKPIEENDIGLLREYFPSGIYDSTPNLLKDWDLVWKTEIIINVEDLFHFTDKYRHMVEEIIDWPRIVKYRI